MPTSSMYIRVKQALNYLKRNDNIMQKDLAEKMGMAESSFTRAMARLKEKNDDSFVIKLQSVASNLSLDYLLTGEGSLLQSNQEAVLGRYPAPPGMVSEDAPSESLPLWADTLISIMCISPQEEWTTDVSIQAKDASGGVIGAASITAAPFKANRSTEYSGNLFSSGGELGLSLATEWDTPVTGEW